MTAKEESKREIAVPGEVIVSGKEYLPGEGTRRENEDIIASRYGLFEISGRLVKVIPLSGIYMPRIGNVVIGKVSDVSYSGWMIDIKAPYQSFLPVIKVSRFLRGDLTEYFDIGDMIACKVDAVKTKGVDLTIRGRGLGKLDKGIIIEINSNKVPRVIGREGSMIKMIKDNTNCEIIVGQNGIVWIDGSKVEDELKAKEAILYVVSKSFIEGLTDKMKEWFDGQSREVKISKKSTSEIVSGEKKEEEK